MFAAIISRVPSSPPGEFANGEDLLAALAPFAQPDAAGKWQDERGLIVQAVWRNTPQSRHEHAPETCTQTGRVIASWARIDNRAELASQLGLRDHTELTDPQIILAAHRVWGANCAARLEGDFSFVIYDPKANTTYCARDSVGAKPFYYVLTDTHFIAASSVAAIRTIKRLDLTPSLEWIALLASAFNLSGRQAAYDNVNKLPAAHDLVVATDSPVKPRQYFTFDLNAPFAVERNADWVDQYREAFDHAVSVRTRSDFLIGSESSAGLDSASIVASLVEMLPHDREQFHTFAMISAEQEPEKLLALSAMCDVPYTHVLMRPETLRIDDAFARTLTVMGHPPEHGQMLVYPGFFEQSHMLGIRTMMSGFGGDEAVTHHARYLIDEFHHRGEYRAVLDEIEGVLPMRAARFAKRMWRGPNDPDDPLRRLVAHKLEISCLRRDFLEDSGLRNRIEAWMCPERSELTLNALVGVDAGARASQAGRLESSALYASTYGIEYRYPMLDRKLIQQFLATPSIEKRRRSMGRYLHRRATAGRIPDSICWQSTKSMGNFIGGIPAMASQDQIRFDELPDPLRSIIDREAFDQATQLAEQYQSKFEDRAMRTRYFLWLVKQLSVWLNQR